MKRFVLCALLGAFSAPVAICAMHAEAETSEAVVAAGKAWGAAEANGDVAFVDKLLLPEYRSIDANGKATTKAEILATTRSKGGTAVRADEIAALAP